MAFVRVQFPFFHLSLFPNAYFYFAGKLVALAAEPVAAHWRAVSLR
jgi:hypothetical protein